MSAETVEPSASPVVFGRVVPASSVPDTLPGLGDDHSAGSSSVDLEAAVLDTLNEYREDGLLTKRDAGRVALAIQITRVMADKAQRGRTSTYANDARLLNEILAGFSPAEAEGDARLREVMAQWPALITAAMMGQLPAPSGVAGDAET